MKQKRLFIASFASKEVQKTCSKQFEDSLIKWVPAEKLHITWQFWGKQDVELVEPIKVLLADIKERFCPMKISLEKTRVWPSLSRPRVFVWQGEILEVSSKQLISNLQGGLSAICEFEAEKNFVPHLTLARFKKRARIRDKQKFIDYKLPKTTWTIDSIDLVESQLDEDGAKYIFV